MDIRKLVLGYYAILFLAFGAFGFLAPDTIAGLVHLSFQSELGYMDFLAMYGGLFAGIGLYLLYCLKENVESGLVCVCFTMGFMFIARAYKFGLLGQADVVQYVYLAGELFTVILVGGLLYSRKLVVQGTNA